MPLFGLFGSFLALFGPFGAFLGPFGAFLPPFLIFERFGGFLRAQKPILGLSGAHVTVLCILWPILGPFCGSFRVLFGGFRSILAICFWPFSGKMPRPFLGGFEVFLGGFR